jgi:hypothetical protein
MTAPLLQSDSAAPSSPPVFDRAAFFREHSGLLLSAAYLGLIMVGMMYEFWLFWRFRINILYYAEAADFLLVPFREPLVIVVATLPAVIYHFYIRGARSLGNKLAKPGARQLSAQRADLLRRSLLIINLLAMLVWSVAATAKFADYVSTRIREGKRRSVRITTTFSREPIVGTVIGTTSQWIFLYDPKIDHTRMIPVEQIAEILVDRRKALVPRR